MSTNTRAFVVSLLCFSLFTKFLLFPAYRSTDFEVHRNWLAITSSLPVKEWYHEATSEWTLDYPPFFAYFEYVLSLFAPLFDSNMLIVSNLRYASWNTVLFQRLTVILSELVYFFSILRVFRNVSNITHRHILVTLAFLNPGLYFVDHVHFQYNGFLFGILVYSIAFMLEGKDLLGGLFFAILLNFKHIYLYLAPAYFVYLLRHYCFTSATTSLKSFNLKNFIVLGLTVVSVFAISFGPFLAQIPQVLSRLFPFKRGLCHAYWAPNAWALYSLADRALVFVFQKVLRVPASWLGENADVASLTRGLVGDTKFAVLPNVPPLATMIITLLAMLPALYKLWRNPTPTQFLNATIICGWSSFLFGWHVHEKAILIVLIPLCILATQSRLNATVFHLLNLAGYYSLFPLLFRPTEWVLKIGVFVIYNIVSYIGIEAIVSGKNGNNNNNSLVRYYACGLVAVEMYVSVVHNWVFGQDRMAFLPLMVVSGYTAVVVIGCFVVFYRGVLLDVK